MNTDDSMFLCEVARRVNARRATGDAQGTEQDVLDAEDEIVEDQGILPPALRTTVLEAVRDTAAVRQKEQRNVRRRVVNRWRSALELLDECIAYSDYLNSELKDLTFGRGGPVLKQKGFYEHSVKVTGAFLKCLLLLSLQGKSCIIGSEVSLLVRNGLLDGAESRLRSLHEHVVALMVIMNDSTYEISERYQDQAALDDLKRLRALQRNLADPIWRGNPQLDEQIAQEILEVDELAREARSKWGAQAAEQYGWAHPAFPRDKKRIFFSDLEEAAGLDFIRSDYLRENEHVHAAPFATINHFEFGETISTRPRHQNERVAFVGVRTALMMSWASRAATRGICFETEEYDTYMTYFPMETLVESAVERFSESSNGE